VIVVDRTDPEHPKRSLPPVTLAPERVDQALRDLVDVRSTEAPVVSMYWSIPADPGQLEGARAALYDLVRDVRRAADADDLPHAARMSLRADAGRLLELEAVASRLAGHTLGYFRCSRAGVDEAVVLPSWVRNRVELAAKPYVRPLLAVLDEAHRYAVVIVDREHGRLYEFYLGELEAQERSDGRALRKPDFAPGDKEHGVHRKAEELAKRHYRQTVQVLERLVQERDIELVVVGGHADTVPAFLDELPHRLRAKVAGTFIADPNTLTPAAARDQAQQVVDAYERREELQLVTQALERVAAGGRGAVGLPWCLLAADELAIEQLLVDADARAPGRACDSCGWLGLDGEGEVCPVDGQPTRATPDVIDEMATRVIDSSGSVEHVYADTPLRERAVAVAALLRFPVPRPDA
jgi:peptide chain release factor subunit 1